MRDLYRPGRLAELVIGVVLVETGLTLFSRVARGRCLCKCVGCCQEQGKPCGALRKHDAGRVCEIESSLEQSYKEQYSKVMDKMC